MRLLLCLFALSSSLCAAPPRPNIIIHFIDDIGPFGAVKQKTPHFDRMTREPIACHTPSPLHM